MLKSEVAYSLVLFFLAALLEVAGCYLIWQTAKGTKPLWMGISGALMLVGYGLVASQQPAGFGRTYAAYGGVFVILSLLWAWHVDKVKPDLYDIVGAAVIVLGTGIVFFTPRR